MDLRAVCLVRAIVTGDLVVVESSERKCEETEDEDAVWERGYVQ